MSASNCLGPWTSLADKLLHLGYEIAGSAGPEVLRNDDNRGDIRLNAVFAHRPKPVEHARRARIGGQATDR